MRTKNKPVAFRATESQVKIIKTKAEKAKMSLTDYLIATAMQKEINVVEDLKPLQFCKHGAYIRNKLGLIIGRVIIHEITTH